MKGKIVCGSRSDWDKTVGPFLTPRQWRINLDVAICSCHRNPLETFLLALTIIFGGYDFVICVGGKAFALPGVLDAWIYFFAKIFKRKPVLVIAVVLGEPGSRALLAADLSVVEIPGETVLAASPDHAYMGVMGLEEVIRLAEHNLLPMEQKSRTEKPAELEVWQNY